MGKSISLEVLAKSGCRITGSRRRLDSANVAGICCHDLGSNLFFVGPSYGFELRFNFYGSTKRQNHPDESIGLVLQEEGGKFEYRLFGSYASLHIALRGHAVRLVDVTPLEEY